MASKPRRYSPETNNYARLSMCIIGPCTQMMRDVLSKHINPSNLRSLVSKAKLNLNYEQKKQLYSGTVPNVSNFDLTFLYSLLRTLANCPKSTINPPTNGWGIPPRLATEVQLGDDIERIRVMKNDVCSHIKKPELTKMELNVKFCELCDIAGRIDVLLGSGTDYFSELKDMEVETLEYEDEDYYTEQIRELVEINDRVWTIEEKLEKLLERSTEKTKKKLEQFLERSTEKTKKKLEQLLERSTEKTKNMVVICCILVAVISLVVSAYRGEGHPEDIKGSSLTRTIPISIKAHQTDHNYITTKGVEEGHRLLKRHGIVIYTGIKAIGKTTASLETANLELNADNSTQLVEIKNVEKLELLSINETSKLIVFFDDFLRDKRDYLLDNVQNVFQTVSNGIKTGNVKMILTVRRDILDSSLPALEKHHLFSKSHIIDLSLGPFALSTNEKREIFMSYCKSNDIIIGNGSENLDTKLILHKDFRVNINFETVDTILNIETEEIGFPQICVLFVRHRKYTRLGIQFFKNPSFYMTDEINNLRNSENIYEKIKYSILVYLLLNDRKIDMDDINEDILDKALSTVNLTYATGVIVWLQKLIGFSNVISKHDIEMSLIEMHTLYVKKELSVYTFDHDIIFEKTLTSVGKNQMSLLIEYGNFDIIRKNIKTMQDRGHNIFDVPIYINKTHYRMLAKRLISMQKYTFAVDYYGNHPAMESAEFLSEFMNVIEEEGKDKEIEYSCSTSRFGILFSAAFYGRKPLIIELLRRYQNRCCIACALVDGAIGGKKHIINILLKHFSDFSESDIVSAVSNIYSPSVAEIMPIFLKYIFDSNKFNLLNVLQSAFTMSIVNLNTDVAKYILQYRHPSLDHSSIYKTNNTENLTNLHIAAYLGRGDMFEILKELGLDITDRNIHGVSVFQFLMLGLKNPYAFSRVLPDLIESKSPLLASYFNYEEGISFGTLEEMEHIYAHFINKTEIHVKDLDMKLDKYNNILIHHCVLIDSEFILQDVYQTSPALLLKPNFEGTLPMELFVYLGRRNMVEIFLNTLPKIVCLEITLLRNLLELGKQYKGQRILTLHELPHILRNFGRITNYAVRKDIHPFIEFGHETEFSKIEKLFDSKYRFFQDLAATASHRKLPPEYQLYWSRLETNFETNFESKE